MDDDDEYDSQVRGSHNRVRFIVKSEISGCGNVCDDVIACSFFGDRNMMSTAKRTGRVDPSVAPLVFAPREDEKTPITMWHKGHSITLHADHVTIDSPIPPRLLCTYVITKIHYTRARVRVTGDDNVVNGFHVARTADAKGWVVRAVSVEE